MAGPLPDDVCKNVCKEPDADCSDFIMQQTMMRIKDPKVSLDFYTRILGMRYGGYLIVTHERYILYIIESCIQFIWAPAKHECLV